MRDHDPTKLPDEILELEILAAERRCAATAAAMRDSRRNISDEGGNDLIQQNADARAYESALIDERNLRMGRGNYRPAKTGKLQEVVVKSSPKVVPPEPPPTDDEVEGVPILVMDGGFYRAWKKGDPIY